MSNNTAIYLVGHGNQREPRFIELQHKRILRYFQAFNEVFNTRLSIQKVYIDINANRSSVQSSENFPQFVEMLEDIKKGIIDVVLLDLEIGRPHKPYEFMPLINTLQDQNVKVYNSFYDDEDVIKKYLINNYCKDAGDYFDFSDEEDILTYFPGVASKVISEALKDIDNIEISNKIKILNDYKPYTACPNLILISEEKRKKLKDLVARSKMET